MNKSDTQQSVNTKTLSAMREHEIGGKKYIVRSVFVGKQDMKTSILKLAERKTVREMGLDVIYQ
jgi:hypothetical protein